MTNPPSFMNARQVAEYLDLNEKKVYSLVKDGVIPATKVTGKWLFPKGLIDRWLLESSHHGIFNDRLLIGGSDDPLIQHIVSKMVAKIGTQALVSYIATDTKHGLAMLEKGHVDICAIHWGSAKEAKLRHPALIKQYSGHKDWAIFHAFERFQGLMYRPDFPVSSPFKTLEPSWRWVNRHLGSGSERAFLDWLTTIHTDSSTLNIVATCHNERELASTIVRQEADIGFGSQSSAGEFGLAFYPINNEAFELVIPKNRYFRQLVQALLQGFDDEETHQFAQALGGYQFALSGKQQYSFS